MARVKVLTDRGWIEIPPPYTDIRVIEDKRFEITTIRGSVSFTSTNEYLSEYGEYMDEREKMTYKDKRPKGKWIDHQAGWSECSVCGERFILMSEKR